MEDFYDLLGVSENASTEEIKRAWRQQVRRYHPDVNDDARATDQFKTLKKAHEVLADETERAAYDRLGHEKYVDQRLDGLPTRFTQQTDASATSTSRTTTTGRSDPSSSTGSNGSTSRNRTRTDGSHTSAHSTRSARSNGSTRTSTSTQSNTSTGGRTGRSTQSGGTTSSGSRTRSRQSSRSRRTASASTNTSQTRTNTSETAGSTSAGAASSTATSTGRQRSPLLYAWVGVLLAGVLYLAGLWQYLGANAEALSGLIAAFSADPATALTGTFDFVAPGTVALAATPNSPQSLLFPLGVVALAVALVAAVASFGRGLAYLYALGGIAAAASLAVGPLFTLPDGVTLVLVVGCPLVATALFLVDVGRVALAR